MERIWYCDLCEQRIKNFRGFIDMVDTKEPWWPAEACNINVYCDNCRKTNEGYWINLSRIKTQESYKRWMEHLSYKPWFDYMNQMKLEALWRIATGLEIDPRD